MRVGNLSFRRVFVTGLLVTLPAVATAYVLWVVFSHIDGILQPIFTRVFHFRIPGLGFFALLALILLMGLFASHFLGAQIVRVVTSRLERIPLWSPVYRAVRDISEVLLSERSKSFRRVALVQFPRPGSYAVVFVTSEGPTPADAAVGRDLVGVFLPTTPNPTSGFYLMVPREELIGVDLSVEQALKLVISGGAAFEPRGRVPPIAPVSTLGGPRGG